jgi:hypothetical protein
LPFRFLRPFRGVIVNNWRNSNERCSNWTGGLEDVFPSVWACRSI